jgi:competence protein ComEC
MFQWNKYPLLRVLFPLIAGIVVCSYSSVPVPLWSVLLAAVFSILLLAVLRNYRNYQNRSIGGVLIAIAVFSLSICYTSVYVKFQQPPKALYGGDYQTLTVTVAEPPVEKNKSMKLIVKINQYVCNDSVKPCRTKAMLYIAKDEQSKKIVYGDKLICYTKLAEPEPPKNPKEFNYKNYLSKKGINLQGYVNASAWEKLGQTGGSSIFRIANQLRNKFLDIFAAANMDTEELGVISAILLGCDDKLDANLAQSYASAGVAHILNVAGMHVGIIYMILAFLLRFLDRTRQQRMIRTIILLLAIWLYACITGLFPSVIRSATMFTFVALGGLMERKTNTYNGLLTSAIFLLLLNPLLIFHTGFQFSYSAVFGIVWTQRSINLLYIPRTKLGSYIWGIITVSIAAQLFLSPLSFFYFHRFPNYFLLTNVAVISFVPVVIGGGIAVLLSSLWEFAYHWVALGLVYLIKAMNWVVVHIEALPHSVTTNIHISIEQVFLAYGLILTAFFAFKYQNKRALFFALFFAIGVVGVGIHKVYQTNSQKMLLVYHTRSGSVIDCIDGKSSSLFGDSTAVYDAEIYNYNIQSNHIYHQIRKVNKSQNQQFISFNGKTLFTLSEPIHPLKNHPKLKIDYLLLTHKNTSIEAVKDLFDFELLIFDSSLPLYKCKQLKETCQKENIAFHDLKENGALWVRF